MFEMSAFIYCAWRKSPTKDKKRGWFNRCFLPRDAKNFNLQVSSWMVLMESALSVGGTLTENLNGRCSLFLKVGEINLVELPHTSPPRSNSQDLGEGVPQIPYTNYTNIVSCRLALR